MLLYGLLIIDRLNLERKPVKDADMFFSQSHDSKPKCYIMIYRTYDLVSYVYSLK